MPQEASADPIAPHHTKHTSMRSSKPVTYGTLRSTVMLLFAVRLPTSPSTGRVELTGLPKLSTNVDERSLRAFGPVV